MVTLQTVHENTNTHANKFLSAVLLVELVHRSIVIIMYILYRGGEGGGVLWGLEIPLGPSYKN